MDAIKVFISYTKADYARGASPLAQELRSCGYQVYLFQHKQELSPDYNREIKNTIENADIVVVLWSEFAKRSTWVEDEIAFARSIDKQFVVVLLDDIRKPDPLIAREDGIRAFDDKFGWKAKVAEQIKVYVRHPRKVVGPYRPEHLPVWMNLVRNAGSVVIMGPVAMQGFKALGFSVERRSNQKTD
jgi:hypothetical protein